MNDKQQLKKLNLIRDELLKLHEALMDFQVREYEKLSGKIENRGKLYELMTNHPLFYWLRSLSGLIVSLDEIDAKPENLENAEDLFAYIQKLLSPNEEGNEFSQKYHQAIQNFPDALVAHGKVVQLLKE